MTNLKEIKVSVKQNSVLVSETLYKCEMLFFTNPLLRKTTNLIPFINNKVKKQNKVTKRGRIFYSAT